MSGIICLPRVHREDLPRSTNRKEKKKREKKKGKKGRSLGEASRKPLKNIVSAPPRASRGYFKHRVLNSARLVRAPSHEGRGLSSPSTVVYILPSHPSSSSSFLSFFLPFSFISLIAPPPPCTRTENRFKRRFSPVANV